MPNQVRDPKPTGGGAAEPVVRPGGALEVYPLDSAATGDDRHRAIPEGPQGPRAGPAQGHRQLAGGEDRPDIVDAGSWDRGWQGGAAREVRWRPRRLRLPTPCSRR